jgi:NADPH-dependent 2,4-dienoyl-CoA reductase/sulfur reductase-like enzyme
MNKLATDILIIGGGAAGMAAALSASSNSGVSILIIDDNPRLGGQIWRAELGKIKSSEAAELIRKIDAQKIRVINGAQLFAQKSENSLICDTAHGSVEIDFEKLILATGARERFLPFPNWTLPNVFGAGGLQALVKNGMPVENKRIVVAGTGPLLLVVADYLKSKGAKVLLIAEQATAFAVNKFAAKLILQPKKVFQAVALRARLFGTSYLNDCVVVSVDGTEKLEAVNLTRGGKTWRVECDMLACGFHLVPNIEAASMVGCDIKNGTVDVDEVQKTSIENVFCAGEPTGIGGVELSLIEGKIAGFAAIDENEKASSFFGKRAKMLRFADSLNQTFALREELKNPPKADTIVCRCEDVRFGELKTYGSFREAKLQTRCGMGACQGRICGAATEFLFNWERNATRPPIFPVRLESLSSSQLSNEKKVL